MMRDPRRTRRRRKPRPQPIDLEAVRKEVEVRYGLMLIEELEHYKKQRLFMSRRSRKRKKQADSWII